MIKNILRKILVVLIIISPVLVNADCKKQAKCGCNGDVIQTLNKQQANVIFTEDRSTVYFYLVSDPTQSIYYFCNASEMANKLDDVKSGDVMLVTGEAYWECSFLYQSSNYSYYNTVQKVFQVQVKDVYVDLYGK
ncbi:MAG TPA: hypothetical protein VHO50_12275 [Bacteroidales bacterium]|nr:hypothetical protein [Bacteroidales bacterium]